MLGAIDKIPKRDIIEWIYALQVEPGSKSSIWPMLSWVYTVHWVMCITQLFLGVCPVCLQSRTCRAVASGAARSSSATRRRGTARSTTMRTSPCPTLPWPPCGHSVTISGESSSPTVLSGSRLRHLLPPHALPCSRKVSRKMTLLCLTPGA